MRLNIVLIVLAMFFNCNNEPENSKDYFLVEEADMEIIVDNKIENISSFNILDLGQEKLQEIYDLSVMQKKFPEFTPDISKRLNDIVIGEFSVENSDSVEIRNVIEIKLKDNQSDYKEDLRYFQYDVLSNENIASDTVGVIVLTNKSIIDEDSITTYKFKFKKIN